MPLFLKFTRNGQQVFKGSSKAPGYEGWIELSSVQWGARRFAPPVNSQERAPPANVSDVVITMETDSSSSELFRESLNPPSESLTAEIDFVREGSGPTDPILTFTLDNVMITSISMGGGQGTGKTPLEQLTLNFTKVAYDRHVQGP
jgi:type VI secretion system secreted protein Hcp